MILNLLLLAAQVYTSPFSVADGSKIIGGIKAEGKYPWLLSLQYDQGHFCGGTLLNSTILVTAGHCSIDWQLSRLNVYGNINNILTDISADTALQFKVEKIVLHPKYNKENLQYDVAVWKIRLVNGDQSRIPAVDMVLDDGLAGLANTTLRVAGWGKMADGNLSNDMLETRVVTVSTEECQKHNFWPITDDKICATTQGRDTCQGDSGGPMFMKTIDNRIILVGITSSGEGSCGGGIPGPYARMSYHKEWIQSTISSLNQ